VIARNVTASLVLTGTELLVYLSVMALAFS